MVLRKQSCSSTGVRDFRDAVPRQKHRCPLTSPDRTVHSSIQAFNCGRHCPHSVRECLRNCVDRPSVRLSSRSTAATACGGFAADRLHEEVHRATWSRRSAAAAPQHGAAARRSAENTVSVMLTADIGSWTAGFAPRQIWLIALRTLPLLPLQASALRDLAARLSRDVE